MNQPGEPLIEADRITVGASDKQMISKVPINCRSAHMHCTYDVDPWTDGKFADRCRETAHKGRPLILVKVQTCADSNRETANGSCSLTLARVRDTSETSSRET